MKTTLNRIRSHSPCAEGWATLLRHLGKTTPDDEPLDLLTILDSNGLYDALWCLRAVDGHDREIRLYAVWCARQVQHLMSDEHSIAALDVAERFANGEADQSELDAASAAAWEAASAAWSAARYAAWSAAKAAAWAAGAAWAAAWAAAGAAAGAAAWAAASAAGEAAGGAKEAELRRLSSVEAERDRLAAENARLIEDRASFPNSPDDIGRMISSHINNLKAMSKSHEDAWLNALARADRLAAECEALREALSAMGGSS